MEGLRVLLDKLGTKEKLVHQFGDRRKGLEVKKKTKVPCFQLQIDWDKQEDYKGIDGKEEDLSNIHKIQAQDREENGMAELGNCKTKKHNYDPGIQYIKATHKDIIKRLEVVHRGNGDPEDETRELLDQVKDGGHSTQGLNSWKRSLEKEEELQAALEREEDEVCTFWQEINEIKQKIN